MVALSFDWNDAYAIADHIPDGSAFPGRWAQDAAAFREQMHTQERARIDIAYGSAERECWDLFLPLQAALGLMVYVHGGYWRAFDKSNWSHLAQGALERGYAVAIPSYTLAPEARISQITGQVARAITQASGMIPQGPIHLVGHSAGGHLVTRMVCTPSPLGQGAAQRIGNVVSISGVHDLRPLLRTDLNKDLRLDLLEATAESPALLMPREGVRMTAWVGEQERPEFIRQSRLIDNIWFGCGAQTRLHIAPDLHHFNVIDGLADARSGLCNAIFAE